MNNGVCFFLDYVEDAFFLVVLLDYAEDAHFLVVFLFSSFHDASARITILYTSLLTSPTFKINIFYTVDAEYSHS